MSTGIVTRRKSAMHIDNSYGIDVVAANTNLVSKRVLKGEPFNTQIVCDAGYSIYEITIKMGGVDITSTAYDATYNMISIASVTGDVDIECYAMHTMPSDYIRVDGIKNPSNAYLDTGYKVTPNDKVSLKVYLVKPTSNYTYPAASKSPGATVYAGSGWYIHTQYMFMCQTTRTNNTTIWPYVGGKLNTIHELIADYYKNEHTVVGETTKSFNERKTETDYNNTNLFSRDGGNDAANTVGQIIYYFKIYDYATTSYVRYYIPCLNDSGVAGFWDAARGVFQGSSNSTAFEAVAADGGDFRLINFEDSAVKNICVTNWGGHYKAGEMYTPEARAVTTFGNKFENNKDIVKFNELQYFTGLTTLTSYREGQYIGGMSYFGAFHHCTNLEEITLPTITMNGSKIGGLFYSCSKLKTVDMSPVTITGTAHICNICAICSALTSAILPTASVPDTYLGAIYAFQNCTSLLTVDASRVNFANMSFTNSSNIFPGATKLTRIIGGLSGFRNTESSIKACPLTHDAAVELLESLGTVTTARTITLKTSTYNTLTAEEKAIATDKGWTLKYG